MEIQLYASTWGMVQVTGPMAVARRTRSGAVEVVEEGLPPVRLGSAGQWISADEILGNNGWVLTSPWAEAPGRWGTGPAWTAAVRRLDQEADDAAARRLDAMTEAIRAQFPQCPAPAWVDDDHEPHLMSVYPYGGSMPTSQRSAYAAVCTIAQEMSGGMIRGRRSFEAEHRLYLAIEGALWGSGPDEIRSASLGVRRDDAMKAVLTHLEPVAGRITAALAA